MAIREKTNVADLVTSFHQEAAHARRVWVNWLGVGSGGGIIALLSFAANLPDPDHALRLLAPALAAFILAIVMAALALLSQAEEHASAASYYAEEHNSIERRAAAKAVPQFLASPPALAKRMNAQRDSQLKEAKEHHKTAESESKRRVCWQWLRRLLMLGSASSFVIGASYPLYLVWAGFGLAPATAKAEIETELEESDSVSDAQKPGGRTISAQSSLAAGESQESPPIAQDNASDGI